MAKDLLAKFESISDKLYSTREAKVADSVFVLRSLSAVEDMEAHEAANPYTKIAYLYALKLETLSRSVIEVDGVAMPDVVDTGSTRRGVPEKKERHIFLREALGKFPQEAIDLLFRDYGILAEEVAKAIDENHPLRTGKLPRVGDKVTKSLAESEVKELVAREVEERRMAEQAEAEAEEATDVHTSRG